MRKLILILVLFVFLSCKKELQVKSSDIVITYKDNSAQLIRVQYYSEIVLQDGLLYFKSNCSSLRTTDLRYYSVVKFREDNITFSNCK